LAQGSSSAARGLPGGGALHAEAHPSSAPPPSLRSMAAISFVVVAAAILDLAAAVCTAAGDNCADTKCCSDAAMKCFKKNTYWASCKKSCDPTLADAKDGKKWTCEVLSANASSRCSAHGQECTQTTCCADASQKCFEKNEYFASCSGSCTPGDWSCKVRPDKCTEAGDDCSKTGCCQRGDMKCYKKNEYWASCRKACDPSVPDEDDGATWDCAPVAQPAAGPAPTPAPAPSTTPKPEVILDNSGMERPLLYGP